MVDHQAGSADQPAASGILHPAKPKHGIGAIETGMLLLRVLASTDEPMPLKAIAAAAGMPPAKAHRYLASFAASEMVVQERKSGRYDLGPMALRVGVAAIRRHDTIARACNGLTALRDAIRATCFVAGWSDRGPLVLRWEDSLRPVTVIVAVGSTLPLLTSATGRAFLGFLPEARIAAVLERERLAAGLSREALAERVASIRRAAAETGFGRTRGAFQNGIAALSVPLRDPFGAMVGAVTALGREEEFDADAKGPVARLLTRHAAGLGDGDR